MEGGARSFLSRPRLRSRAHTAAKLGTSALLELETLSNYSALEARAVTLSADEALVVARLAEMLLADTLRAYERFLSQGGRANPREWKLIKRKDQLAVFKQRREAAPQPPRWAANASSNASTSDVTGDVAATAQRETTLPLMLAAGTLPSGTGLDDAMFGLVSASTREFKLSSAYAEENAVVDAAVLSALEVPSSSDPFRFLGLKWVARRHAGSLKKRDALFLESTGITSLPNGERVGYRVMHSVSVRALAQLGAVAVADSVVRAKTSVVQLFHEAAPPTGNAFAHAPVRVFARGFYDPMGGMMQFVALSVATDLMLTLAHGVSDCAHLKKIARAAQRAQRDRMRRRRRSTSTAMAAGCSPGARKSLRYPPGNRYHQVDSNMHGIVEVDEAMTSGDVVLYPPTYIGHDTDPERSGAMEPEDEPVLELSPSMCHVCECSLGGVFDRSAAPCTICFHMICSRCSVTKKLRFSWSDEGARGLAHAHAQLVGSGVDTSGGGITASSTSQSQGSTERSRSRSRSGSGGNSLLSALHGSHAHMADVAEKPLNFCLPCVVAANQQSGALLAIEEMTSASTTAPSALRTRTASYLDGMTPKSSTTPMGRATAGSIGYGGSSRLSVSSTTSGASASTTPRQRWTRGASIYGARPSYDLLDYYNTGSSSRPPQHRATTSQYFPQTPQHQYRIYSGGNSNNSSQGQRQKAFSMAASTPRDSAPKVVLFDAEDYARRASRV